MWAYQKDMAFKDLLPDRGHIARSYDEYANITPGGNIRGHGGVAIVWKERINPYIKTTKDGNERILPVILKLPHADPLCIINCYLPSGNSRAALETYAEDLAHIKELVEKHKDCNILIAGDLNADILHRNAKKEVTLATLIKDLKLKNLNAGLEGTSTYNNIPLRQSSHIDYFLSHGLLDWSSTQITPVDTDEGCLNNSTHNAIMTTVHMGHIPPMKVKERDKQQTTAVKWEKIDKVLYQETLSEELNKTDFTLLDTDTAMEIYTSTLQMATLAAHPKLSNSKRDKKDKKKRSSPAVKDASNKAKHNFWKWKIAGRPGTDNPLTRQKNISKKNLRSIQRREEAIKRQELLDEIMAASETDSKTFHKLIRRNRNLTSNETTLNLNGKLENDHAVQTDAWADYFENLSKNKDHHVSEINENTFKIIRQYNNRNPGEQHQFTVYDVEMAIKRLNKNKAADMDGITAEHLQLANLDSLKPLTTIINNIFTNKECPVRCKSGFKIPLPKKGKDNKLQSNYRGITITAIIGKVVEHLIQNDIEDKLQLTSPDLQFGFSRGLSPNMASLILNETIATAKAEGKDLYVASLDAQKAFDVVNHMILKSKLHHEGIQGRQWCIIDNLYTDVKECVRWKGAYSRNFEVQKGVRQGAILSTTLYKLFIGDLLKDLKTSTIGTCIGNIYVGTPTCADDVLLIADEKPELQAMLDYSYDYSRRHQYSIHPEKSTVTHYIKKSTKPKEDWTLGEGIMTETDKFNHLGIDWTAEKTTPDILGRINTARKTVYALMGNGVHGQNGLSPATSIHIIHTYVIPRLLYGLDASLPSKKQRQELNDYHRLLLRQIQGLPRNTANESIYLLLGELPLEAELDCRILTLYGAISRANNNTTLQTLRIRQIALGITGSWFFEVTNICHKYKIDVESTLQTSIPWRKDTWKEYVNSAVKGHWLKHLIEATIQKTSTRWISITSFRNLQSHPVWSSCISNSRLVPAAVTRARMLTRNYPVQARKLKYKQTSSALCPLCGDGEEDLEHFLLLCVTSQHIRNKKLQYIQSLGFTPTSAEELLNGPSSQDRRINREISELCHRLHNFRCSKQ